VHHGLETLADPATVAKAGAAARGSFHFAVSGGHTPWAMFASCWTRPTTLEASWLPGRFDCCSPMSTARS
jgi:6-phosphogluconolactonase/glucosamine-6-phosphate isomerase/deaminase